MSFPTERSKREHGSGIIGTLFWRGHTWTNFLPPANSFQNASRAGHAVDMAFDFPNSPGVIEIAITHAKVPGKRIKVFIKSVDSLQEYVHQLAYDGGELKGFLQHALKAHHGIWIRSKVTKSLEEGKDFVEGVLKKFDYAWIQQPGAKARSIVVRPTYCCCSHFNTGVILEEGPPKFETQKSRVLGFLSGKKR